ncbi:hypothetical protein AOCH_000591 [Aspergillus ochraceoroseus]|uniref:Mono-/di-acylglycerol lipase N-terminal domain-containing protein n=1 Tax=Aspergillus ochraceoroseus TaxID=138278 RepID=A0A0F8UGS4_9EURO|nr:hypothetical protein AOCH_000591 [Aspergillus ochraceoroseus]
MVSLGSLSAVLAVAFAGLSVAAPLTQVSSGVLQDLTLFAEYSAASYCTVNINSTGNKVVCSAGNCPLVEQAHTETLREFHESVSAMSSETSPDSWPQTQPTNSIVLSFRGSRTLDTWIATLDFGLTADWFGRGYVGFMHVSPEYWITRGDDMTVTSSDIEVIEGVGSTKGNAGEVMQSISAHSWYIVEITACN